MLSVINLYYEISLINNQERYIMEKTHIRKDKVFVQSFMKKGSTQYMIYEEGSIEYKSTFIDQEKNEYKPINKQYPLKDCIVLPPEDIDLEADENEVWIEIFKFWKANLLIDEDSLAVLTAFTYHSWFYDSMESVPYLLILGDLGTAKTRILEIAGMLCFNATSLGTAVTSANIFRLQDIAKGTLMIDEFERNQTDRSSNITQILNSGYRKSGAVLRCEPKTNEPIPYDTYGPKIIATRSMPEDDALVSRCIVVRVDKKSIDELKNSNIPLDMTPAIRAKAEILRGKLIGLRFRLADKKSQNNNIEFASQSPRDRQILSSLISAQPENMQSFLAQKIERKLLNKHMTAGLQLECEIARIICGRIEADNNLPIKISIEEMKAMVAKVSGRHYENKTITSACRRMKFELKRSSDGMYIIINDVGLMDGLMEKYLLVKAA